MAKQFAVTDAMPETFSDALGDMSAEEAAYRLGTSHQSVRNWREGKHVPGEPTRRRMAKVFRYPLPVVNSWFPKDASA